MSETAEESEPTPLTGMARAGWAIHVLKCEVERAIREAETKARNDALDECVAFGTLMEEYCETGDPTYDSGQQAAITEYQNKIRSLKSKAE